MTSTKKLFALLIWIVAAAFTLSACGEDSANDTTTTTQDELSEGVPSADMLAFSLSEQATTSQNLSIRQDPLTGQPSEVRAKAEAISAEVREHVVKLHELMDTMRAQTTSTTFEKGAAKCRAWELDSDSVHWRLVACQGAIQAKRFGFILQGRPAASTDDADYKLIAAGEHTALGQGADGSRQGAGRVGYNLDNRFALTGKGAQGKAGVGYRAAGRYRHIDAAFKDLLPEGSTEPARSARYTFRRVVGKGGVLRYASVGDFVSRDDTQALVQGQDGVMERGRATLAWRADGAARSAAIICGGTVGDGQCARTHQCWTADLNVTYEELSEDVTATPTWEPTSCPSDADLAIVDDAPPTEGDVTPPTEATEGAESTGLDVPEPEAAPTLEAE